MSEHQSEPSSNGGFSHIVQAAAQYLADPGGALDVDRLEQAGDWAHEACEHLRRALDELGSQ